MPPPLRTLLASLLLLPVAFLGLYLLVGALLSGLPSSFSPTGRYTVWVRPVTRPRAVLLINEQSIPGLPTLVHLGGAHLADVADAKADIRVTWQTEESLVIEVPCRALGATRLGMWRAVRITYVERCP